MTFGTHALAGVLIALSFNLPVLPSVLGSVAPDVDLKLGLQRFRQERGLFKTHRGITHHLLVAVAFLLLSLAVRDLVNRQFGIYLLSFAVGYASHLFLDALNPLGVPYGFGYYPRFSLKLMRSGGKGEIFVILVLIAGLLFLSGNGNAIPEQFLGNSVFSLLKKSLKEVFDEVFY